MLEKLCSGDPFLKEDAKGKSIFVWGAGRPGNVKEKKLDAFRVKLPEYTPASSYIEWSSLKLAIFVLPLVISYTVTLALQEFLWEKILDQLEKVKWQCLKGILCSFIPSQNT